MTVKKSLVFLRHYEQTSRTFKKYPGGVAVVSPFNIRMQYIVMIKLVYESCKDSAYPLISCLQPN